MAKTILTTARLHLREWEDADLGPFAAMNADARVMEFYPKVLTRKESDATAGRIREHFDRYGFGLWAVEAPGIGGFLGYVGLMVPHWRTVFAPCVEVGWRLAADAWGKGYATEAARVALADGFGRLGLHEILSFTVPANRRSRGVMQRLGMSHDPADDFDHPMLPEGHALRRHVLYRVAAPTIC